MKSIWAYRLEAELHCAQDHGAEQATARATTEADSSAALRNDKQKDRQLQGQRQNTGILHCVQDDDEERATAKDKQGRKNKQRKRIGNGKRQQAAANELQFVSLERVR
jgi:hypothetical protein